MKLSMKSVGLISAVVCVVAAVILIDISRMPSRNTASLSDYIKKHESSLIELTTNYPNQYKKLNGYLGIDAIDTRAEGHTDFVFPWSYDISEGSSYLIYTSSGILNVLGDSISDTTCIYGLGINGKGYISCTKIKQNWFFVESYLPT